MTKSGKSDSTTPQGPYQPGVVIAAEIAFAALLLYLTNHPLDNNDLAQASLSTDRAQQDLQPATTSFPMALKSSTEPAGVEVAVTTRDTTTDVILGHW